ncbi:exported hypothetical protein [uncultured Eubacteriales bacterium]|uniref:Uncharacterized protein n=1 Tax=uncultured Eubacteriales bacterium TaxID=172733 RepID=A0A212JP46_9FIRM|nr:exported hypothetical protein [uncultured Eubacteriales bacterium]
MRIWKTFCFIGGGAALIFFFWGISEQERTQALLAILCTFSAAIFSVLSYIAYLLSRKSENNKGIILPPRQD